MLRPAADHRVHQDYISDHLELTGERKEEEEDSRLDPNPVSIPPSLTIIYHKHTNAKMKKNNSAVSK